MAGNQYTTFDTAAGVCGIAWNDRGICFIQLPRKTEAAAETELLWHVRGAERARPPATVRSLIRRIELHLAGSPQNFSDTPLDLAGFSSFQRRVYRTALRLKSGEVISYGQLAARAGAPGAARAVGTAMAKNPFAIVMPCHRVIASGNKLGGYGGGRREDQRSAVELKRRLLELEGVQVSAGGTVMKGQRS